MSKVVIKNKVLINSNKKYFRTGAEKTLVGAFGKKEKNLLNAYFYRHFEVGFNNAAVQIYGPYVLDAEKTRKIDFEIPVETPVANGKATVTYEMMKSQKLKFIQLYISGAPLIDALNKDAKALEYLKMQGDKARIIDCIFVAIEAEFYSNIDFGADITAKSTVKGVEISLKLKGGGSSESKLVLAQNTTIAYGMVEPIWNNAQTQIIDLDPDLRGAG